VGRHLFFFGVNQRKKKDLASQVGLPVLSPKKTLKFDFTSSHSNIRRVFFLHFYIFVSKKMSYISTSYASTRPGETTHRVLPFTRISIHDPSTEDDIFFVTSMSKVVPMTHYHPSHAKQIIAWEKVGTLLPTSGGPGMPGRHADQSDASQINLYVAKGDKSPDQFSNVQLNRLALALGISCQVFSGMGLTFCLGKEGQPAMVPLADMLDFFNSLVAQGPPILSKYVFAKRVQPIPLEEPKKWDPICCLPPPPSEKQDRGKKSESKIEGIQKKRKKRSDNLIDSLSAYFTPKNGIRISKR
jgi:hypothetical protein